MNRRSATWMLRILLVLTLLAAPGATLVEATGASPVSPVSALATTAPPTTTPDGEIPTDTANPFLPEERDLTDCLGLLQRPGCGSEARGGLGQTLVAIAMVAGLLLIFGRVAWGVHRNRKRQELPADDSGADHPTDGPVDDSDHTTTP